MSFGDLESFQGHMSFKKWKKRSFLIFNICFEGDFYGTWTRNGRHRPRDKDDNNGKVSII